MQQKENTKIKIEQIQPQSKSGFEQPAKRNLIQIPLMDSLSDKLKVTVEDDLQRKRKDSFFGLQSQLKNDYEDQQPEIN
jgi:hypothetical protein